MVLRDKFWLWGHPEGRYNAEYGNENKSRMTPMESCMYLGVRNIFMVPVQWEVNARQYNKSFRTLNEVGWGYRYPRDLKELEEIMEYTKEFPNITCVALDDFKNDSFHNQRPIEELAAFIDKLHNNQPRRLDTWMILYTWLFGTDAQEDQDFQKYVDLLDGVIMWTWKESDVPLIPEKFELFKKMTENKRRMVGVYLYNFGESKQATGEAVKWQLDFWREKLLAGEIEGIVLHTNTMADLDYEAYDAAIEWMDQHGDEEI